MQINSHVILSHIDSPARILIWPANQVLICSVPFALGMLTEHIFVGVGLSVVAAFLFKIFQKRFGKGKIRSMLYWHLPTSVEAGEARPSTIIRSLLASLKLDMIDGVLRLESQLGNNLRES